MLTKQNWLDVVFPVGYVYISYESISPAEKFGGAWAEIKDAFPYFGSDTSTGGSNEMVLTVNQLPSHKHTYTAMNQLTSSSSQSVQSAQARNNRSNYYYAHTYDTSEVGQGQPINNMPAYQSLYAWRRIS